MSFRSLHSFINDRVVSQSAQLAHNHNTTSGEYRRLGEHREAIMANGEEEEEESDEGKRVSGLLYKWVNYARGWRPRWFVLEEGVLSYYKMHGPHNLLLTPGADSKVIGQESLRRIATHLDCTSRHPQPLGQFHLMVCSFRENKSDQRRFCVYTGTKKKKKLHLKAENKEDRATWVEALQDAKDNSNMFPPPPPPPPPSTRKVMVPADSSGVPTDRLRQRLLEEGVGETAIRDSENIMRTELSHVLNHNHSFLLETTEKVDLEHEHVKSNKHSMDDVGYYLAKRQNRTDGSASDHEAFFDACDILSTCSDSSTRSHHHGRPHLSSEHEETTTNGKYDAKLPHGSVGSNYPPVRRRKKLPDPTEKETRASLWSLIKDNIGKDLTRVCLPVYFNEPISSLQKCFEDMEYSYLLDQAYTWGKMGNSLMRMLHVAAFAVSGYACTEGRSCKPFNPLLGETYEAEYPEKGIRFISEKVSQHPMILACHCEGRGWTLWGDSNLKSKFWGRSIHLDPVGVLTLKFDDGEVFQWSKVTTAIYNLIFGKLYCDHYGTMRIHGNREYSCKLKFKEQSIIDRIPHQVHGLVEDNRGKTVATIYGKWDESLQYEIFEKSEKGEMCNKSSEAQTIWKQSDPVPLEYQTRYNLTEFAITLNEITPGLREKLAPTDSRLRPDQRCLENGEYEKSNAEKLRLEQRQRQARKMQENGWKPRWFALDKSSKTYCYVGGYWEAREKGNWESCHDIFGQLPTDTNLDQTH